MVCYLQEGLIALWKGWLPSVIGVIPYVGLNFAVYETLKDVVLKFYGEPYHLEARPWRAHMQMVPWQLGGRMGNLQHVQASRVNRKGR